ncbi:hypothetical protein KEM54_004625 [Ascosphaera aggregata]|nr:hypothetical protein KEM54_004625 [Ascosphaera aggregata]
MPSTANISTRVLMRWPPEPAYENANTLKLAVGGWYVDLRIDKQKWLIDWATAGEKIVESRKPLTIAYTHIIDSHQDFDVVDRGTYTSLSNGDDLEIGVMPRKDLPGAPIRPYREVWRNLEPESEGTSWVLESLAGMELETHPDEVHIEPHETRCVVKTFLAKIPGYFMAMRQELRYTRVAREEDGKWITVKSGGEVCARKQTWVEPNFTGLGTDIVTGPGAKYLPTLRDVEGLSLELDKMLIINGEDFIVRAFEDSRLKSSL